MKKKLIWCRWFCYFQTHFNIESGLFASQDSLTYYILSLLILVCDIFPPTILAYSIIYQSSMPHAMQCELPYKEGGKLLSLPLRHQTTSPTQAASNFTLMTMTLIRLSSQTQTYCWKKSGQRQSQGLGIIGMKHYKYTHSHTQRKDLVLCVMWKKKTCSLVSVPLLPKITENNNISHP